MSIVIRVATIKDLDQIMNIEKSCLNKGELFSVNRMRYLITKAKGITFVAQEKEVILGYLTILTNKNWRRQRIYNIAVDSNVRGKGIGKMLLKKGAEYTNGKFFLEVMINNKNAIALYEKNGVKIRKLLKDYYGEGLDGYKMY